MSVKNLQIYSLSVSAISFS